jgi:hypothetical protein
VPGAPHEVLLVIDATTGQNGLAQAREFTKAAVITGVVLTKLDGTAKGGVALVIRRELNVPIRYVGVGEGLDDLLDFDPEGISTACSATRTPRERRGVDGPGLALAALGGEPPGRTRSSATSW